MEEVPEVVVGAGVDGVDGRVRGEGPVGVRTQRVQHGAEVGVVLSPAGQRLREIRTQVRQQRAQPQVDERVVKVRGDVERTKVP